MTDKPASQSKDTLEYIDKQTFICADAQTDLDIHCSHDVEGLFSCVEHQLGRVMRKRVIGHMRTAKAQIRLRGYAV